MFYFTVLIYQKKKKNNGFSAIILTKREKPVLRVTQVC